MSRHVNFLRQDESSNGPSQEEEEYLLQLEEEKRAASYKTKMLIISFVGMLIFGLANKVTQILQFKHMRNYDLFLSIISTFWYIPVSCAYVLPMLKWGSAITPEQRAIPWSLWIKIGILDAMAGIMQVLTINIINNGTLVVLLSQTAIPVSMICSKYFLGQKYTWAHYIGVTIVMCGLAVVLIPRFLKKKKNDDGDEEEASTIKMLIAIGVFVASNLPMCFSTVIKELSLGEQDVDPIYMNLMVAIPQFIFSFPLLIPSGYSENITVTELPQHLLDGFKCYTGTNTITNTTNAMAAAGLLYYTAQQISASNTLQKLQQQINIGSSYVPHAEQDVVDFAYDVDAVLTAQEEEEKFNRAMETAYENSFASLANTYQHSLTAHHAQLRSGDDKKPDDCKAAPLFVNMYICANLFYNVLIILLIKFGSAVLFYICMSILLPLSSFAFAMPFMPDPVALSKFDIMGLVVLLGGLFVFRFWGMIFKKKEEEAGADAERALLDGDVEDSYGTAQQPQQQQQSVVASAPKQQSSRANTQNNYLDANANVEDPFGDAGNYEDDYQPAQVLQHVDPSSSINNGTGKKKAKKAKK